MEKEKRKGKRWYKKEKKKFPYKSRVKNNKMKKTILAIMIAIIIIAPAMAFDFEDDAMVNVNVITGNFTNITQANDVSISVPISSSFDNYVLTWSDSIDAFRLLSLAQNQFWNRTSTNLYTSNPEDTVGLNNTSPSALLNINSVAGGSLSGGLAFGDGNTGFYESSDNTLKIHTGGSDRAEWTTGVYRSGTSGSFYMPYASGSSSVPVYSFRGDEDTGTARSGINEFSIIVGGSQMMELINSTSTIEFNGGWASGGASIIDGDGYFQTGYFVNLSALGVDELHINGSLLPNITETFDIGSVDLLWEDAYFSGEIISNGTGDNYFLGNVGIGTTGPTRILSVSGSATPYMSFSPTITNNEWVVGSDGEGFVVYDDTNDEYRMAISKTDNAGVSIGTTFYASDAPSNGLIVEGNVGIGQTAPSGKLEIVSGSNDYGTVSILSGASNLFPKLFLGRTSGELTIAVSHATNGFFTGTTAGDGIIRLDSDTNKLHFGVGSGSPEMTIIDGNVGIGTTAPWNKLSVSPDSTSGEGISITAGQSVAAEGGTQITFDYGQVGGGYAQAIRTRHNSAADANNAIDFYTWDQGTDAIGTPGTKLGMSINNGNVGIGTSTPSSKLEVNGTITLANNATIYDNSTCLTLVSPDGSTQTEICNA